MYVTDFRGTDFRGADVDHTLEAEIRDSLHPREAPEGFTDRMMARIPERRSLLHWPVTRPLWTSAVAAALLLAVFLGVWANERQQRIAGEHARQQVLLALRITNATLQAVQQKISEDQTEKDTQ
jgi:hypothetical protein